MNVGGDGVVLSKVDTGDGVDDIHYESASHTLYVVSSVITPSTRPYA
jgi:hypothetical protein